METEPKPNILPWDSARGIVSLAIVKFLQKQINNKKRKNQKDNLVKSSRTVNKAFTKIEVCGFSTVSCNFNSKYARKTCLQSPVFLRQDNEVGSIK